MIFEDPDELGYFDTPPLLVRCYGILPQHEAAEIEQAAMLAFRGFGMDAERTRRYANYHNLSFRPDADSVR